MSHELQQVLRRYCTYPLLGILAILRRENSVLVDELEVFLSCYPAGCYENALFFLPEYEVSESLTEVLLLNPCQSLVELGMGLRDRGANVLAAELSNLIEMFPGMGTTESLLPSFVLR